MPCAKDSETNDTKSQSVHRGLPKGVSPIDDVRGSSYVFGRIARQIDCERPKLLRLAWSSHRRVLDKLLDHFRIGFSPAAVLIRHEKAPAKLAYPNTLWSPPFPHPPRTMEHRPPPSLLHCTP